MVVPNATSDTARRDQAHLEFITGLTEANEHCSGIR